MHQTFYIDLEEEISSVIDRLNKSMSVDNYFVIPKRAIFLQSIVNLKLLKREADKVGKRVIIVTQDEVGASMAQRSGIDVRSTLEGMEPVQDIDEEIREADVVHYDASSVVDHLQQKKRVRLREVGSVDFYDSAVGPGDESFHASAPVKHRKSTIIPVNSISSPVKRSDSLHGKILHTSPHGSIQAKIVGKQKPQVISGLGYKKKLDSEKERVLEKIYSPKETDLKELKKTASETEIKIKKIFIGFIGLCFLAFIGVFVYLFLPSAKIIIEPNILKSKINLDLHGSVDTTQADQTNIPIEVVEKEESISLSYDVKGGATTTGKKAHGSVVIYNEYDNSSQTLIATTRLESADGKIFRLVKNTVVPGITTIDGEVKPGAITAEIIADQSGSDYNLEPTSFTIPGFKDGPKYAKFYAKSTEQMMGGSTDGETAGGAVSQQDIDSAKQKTEAALKDKLAQAINAELHDGLVMLQQAEKITIIKSGANAKVGDMAGTFDYTVVASLRTLVFSENDVKKTIEQSLANEQQSQDVKMDISKIEYGTVNSDFDKNTLELKVYSEIIITPIMDLEQIRRELLGKTDDQLSAILRKYSAIKSVNVEFSPTFVSRIPQYAQRVSVEIKNDAN